MKVAEKLYQELNQAGIEALFDDRDERAGVKFKDADLIGIPYRAVISEKTGNKIEIKKRNENKTKLFTEKELIKLLRNTNKIRKYEK